MRYLGDVLDLIVILLFILAFMLAINFSQWPPAEPEGEMRSGYIPVVYTTGLSVLGLLLFSQQQIHTGMNIHSSTLTIIEIIMQARMPAPRFPHE